MAGTWIIMHTNLTTNPKVKRIARSTDSSIVHTIGRLYAVWSMADEHSTDGLIEAELADIDDTADCEGFGQSMLDAGWLETTDDDGYLQFPNFGDHNGKTAKTRYQSTKRSIKRRTSKTDETAIPANKGTCATQVQRTTVAKTNSCVATEQNSTVQNREEKIKSVKKSEAYSPDFEAWWKTYPARPGCPKGNKREAFAAWSKLDREHQLKAHAATKNLLASIASTNTLPKDAERFLRPPRGQGDPAYLAWVEVATPPPKLRLNDRGTDGGQDMLEKLNREAI